MGFAARFSDVGGGVKTPSRKERGIQPINIFQFTTFGPFRQSSRGFFTGTYMRRKALLFSRNVLY